MSGRRRRRVRKLEWTTCDFKDVIDPTKNMSVAILPPLGLTHLDQH